jgi:hypothetical protein
MIVDYFNRIIKTEVDTNLLDRLNINLKNVRKYRGKIERRKLKIKKIYE